MLDLVIRSERVVTPEGVTAGCVGVHDGLIVSVGAFHELPQARTVVQLAADEVLLPGLVDTHVHVNEPGRTHWEGFASATRAAAAGGVTTIVDMPLNSIPPTVDVAALGVKRAAAQGQCHVDVGFWGGAVPGNTDRLAPLHAAGVFGFKCFLLHSGVDEFPALTVAEMERDLAELARLGALLIVHAEDARVIEEAAAASPSGPAYRDFLGSRPPEAETTAIADVIAAARRTGGRAHILHLSSADALPLIAAAKADGVRLTVETCPHYLCLAAEQVPDGATQFKCCPPIRGEGNRERLWQGLMDGTIDCIVSDHSPSTIDLKRFDTGDFAAAWGGVSSLQLGLSAVWTQAVARGLPITDVVRWMSAAPARLAGLATKGAIAVGRQGDLVAFAPDETFEVDPALLHHKNAVTPYAGSTLQGVVRAAWLRGGRIDPTDPRGRLLTAGEH